MRRVLILALLGAACAAAQSTPGPDCAVAANVAVVGGNGVVPVVPPALTAYYDNRGKGCSFWALSYTADAGLSGYTVAFQSATGSTTPGAFGAYTGNTVASSSSFGTAAQGFAIYSNTLTSGSTVSTPFLRVDLTGASGTGNIFVTLQGWESNWLSASGGGGSGGTGCPNPCPVVGTAAAGAPPSGDPVQVGGSDGTDIRTIKTDANGNSQVVGGIAVGAAAGNPVTTGTRDDSGNVAADYRFPDQADVFGSAVTGIKIVSGVAAKLIYVGHLSISLAAGTTVSVIEGTGTLCATSSATIAGPYQNAVAIALDFTRDDPLKTATTGDDLCLSFGGSSTGGGFVKYAQR